MWRRRRVFEIVGPLFGASRQAFPDQAAVAVDENGLVRTAVDPRNQMRTMGSGGSGPLFQERSQLDVSSGDLGGLLFLHAAGTPRAVAKGGKWGIAPPPSP